MTTQATTTAACKHTWTDFTARGFNEAIAHCTKCDYTKVAVAGVSLEQVNGLPFPTAAEVTCYIYQGEQVRKSKAREAERHAAVAAMKLGVPTGEKHWTGGYISEDYSEPEPQATGEADDLVTASEIQQQLGANQFGPVVAKQITSAESAAYSHTAARRSLDHVTNEQSGKARQQVVEAQAAEQPEATAETPATPRTTVRERSESPSRRGRAPQDGDKRIKVLKRENPYREGTARSMRFSLLLRAANGGNVASYIAAGGKRRDVLKAVESGHIALVD